MSLHTNTPVTIPLSTLIIAVISIITITSSVVLFIKQNSKDDLKSSPTYNSQNNINNLSPEVKQVTVYPNDYSQIKVDNADLVKKNNELYKANTEWKNYANEQIKIKDNEIERLNQLTANNTQVISEINRINKENKDYFSKLQDQGVFGPTEEQKINFRTEINQNKDNLKLLYQQLNK